MRYVCLMIALCCGVLAADEPAKDETRSYRDGPLTADDFKAAPDAKSSFAATTFVDGSYRHRYRVRPQANKHIASLIEIDMWATVNRTKSWNRRPRDPVLMDHEQGHFDIVQIHSLTAVAELRKNFGTGKVLKAEGTTQEAAVEKLETQLKAIHVALIKVAIEEHKKYDKETTNGTDVAAQAEARRDHKERMEALVKKLDAKKK